MTETAKKFVPLFSGTDPKSVIKGQRQFCLTELGAGAKRLAAIETELAKTTKEYQEVGDTLDKVKENYDTLRSPETPIVKLEEFQYVRMQYRDFSAKAEQLETNIATLERAATKERAGIETMRQNVIYLEEKLNAEAKVIYLHGPR
jgi:predicted  nucleic acid-binding Zn-ribbon protein